MACPEETHPLDFPFFNEQREHASLLLRRKHVACLKIMSVDPELVCYLAASGCRHVSLSVTPDGLIAVGLSRSGWPAELPH